MNADDLNAFQREIEEPYLKEIEELREKLRTELKRISSYKTLVLALELDRNHHLLECDKLRSAARTLDSELEMNSMLTNEIERLENVVRELQAQVAGG